MSKVKMYEHKRNQEFKIDNLTKKVANLDNDIETIRTKTAMIVTTCSEGFVKQVNLTGGHLIFVQSENVVGLEFPVDYQAGYYKYCEKTNKFVMDTQKKKEIDLSII